MNPSLAAPTRCLVFLCQRCQATHGEPHDDPEVALRRAFEAGTLHTFHRCSDGGTGICRLVGTSCPHPTAESMLEVRRTYSPTEAA